MKPEERSSGIGEHGLGEGLGLFLWNTRVSAYEGNLDLLGEDGWGYKRNMAVVN